MPLPFRLAALALICVLAVSSCTADQPPEVDTAASASASSSTPRELPPRARAAQLAALAPDSFDAAYRLDSRGARRDAAVRMRTTADRFRLDVERGSATAVLIANPRGVISCQVEDPGKNRRKERACFLVARRPAAIPPLFDPQVQRLFRGSTTKISQLGNDVKVAEAKSWRAPGRLGVAECFTVKGKEVEDGTYCYLSNPGPLIGVLARVVFPSGAMEIRSVERVVRLDAFLAPTSPTPLPN